MAAVVVAQSQSLSKPVPWALQKGMFACLDLLALGSHRSTSGDGTDAMHGQGFDEWT